MLSRPERYCAIAWRLAARHYKTDEEAGVLASNFSEQKKIVLSVLGLFTPSFEVPDFQSGSTNIFASVDTIHEVYLLKKTTFSKV